MVHANHYTAKHHGLAGYRCEITILLWMLLSAGCLLADETNYLDQPQTELASIRSLTGFNNPNAASNWKTSPVAKHHAAVVRIQVGNQGGSGTIVDIEGPGLLVITNAHVVEQGFGGPAAAFARVIPLKGKPGQLPVIYSSRELDLAVLYSPRGSYKVGMPVCGIDPPVGSQIEMIGYGGPTPTFRHFFASRILTRYNDPMAISASTVSGDSGCPMVYKGAIAGVNFGCTGSSTQGAVQDEGGPWRLNYPACSKVTGPKLNEVLTRICGPLGCRPRVRYLPQQPPNQQLPQQAPETPDVPTAPPNPTNPDCACGGEGCQCGPGSGSQQPSPPGNPASPPAGPPQCVPGCGQISLDDFNRLREEVGRLANQVNDFKIPNTRVVLVDGSNDKILDDETYAPGEPIVIDFQRVINAAN